MKSAAEVIREEVSKHHDAEMVNNKWICDCGEHLVFGESEKSVAAAADVHLTDKLVFALRAVNLLVDEGWVSVAERLPESGRDVLLWLVATPEPEVKIKTHIIGLAVGHLDRAAAGNIIMRPLMIKGEHVRQWPAWAIAEDEEDYHEASHWQDTKLPTPPSERTSE